MFLPKTAIETKLDEEITSSLQELANHETTSEEYGVIVKRVSELHKLKAEEKPKLPVNLDTVLTIAANLFGILWITRYEREHIITSKFPSFVQKLR